MAPLPEDAVAEIGLLRPRAGGGFSEAHIEGLRELHPVITAVIRRYWAARSTGAPTPPDSRIDAAFDNFGKPDLSAREAQVMRMVLQGHSSESIGLRLRNFRHDGQDPSQERVCQAGHFRPVGIAVLVPQEPGARLIILGMCPFG